MKGEKARQKPKILFLLVFLVLALAATNIWTAFFYKNEIVAVDDKGDEFNLLNPARKFVKQEDLIINFQPLRDYLNEKYEANQNVSVYFEYLSTGANIAISKDAEFYPASLLKVPIAMAAAKKIEKGTWKWSNELVLMSTDKDDKFGDLYKEKTNTTFSIEELVRRSLSDSDNTAHFILVRNLEMEEINDVYTHIGLKDFMDTDGRISAKRYAVIFRALYNSSYLSEENSQKLLSYLSRSEFKNYLQSALPDDIIFSHKIGIDREKELYLDSGIIYLKNRPYLLTMMVKSASEESAKKIMKDVSGKVYDYVKDYSE